MKLLERGKVFIPTSFRKLKKKKKNLIASKFQMCLLERVEEGMKRRGK